MLIQVTYTDDSFDYVKDFMLDALIEAGSITKFRRSTGWVDVADARVRRQQPEGEYNGEERRTRGAQMKVIDRRILERRSILRSDGDRRRDERRTLTVN